MKEIMAKRDSRMTSLKRGLWMLGVAGLLSLPQVSLANSRGSNDKQQPPQIYTERAEELLRGLSFDEFKNDQNPFTLEQQAELKEILRQRDSFTYSQPQILKVVNKTIPVSLRERQVVQIKLGHTYNTTVVFTDSMGNPWTVAPLSNISNENVVDVVQPAKHLLVFKPKKMAGQVNLPVKLAGEQFPLTLLLDVNEDEVYFSADIKVDGVGDSSDSQRFASLRRLNNGERVPPKLNAEPAREAMLQFMTPEGYTPVEIMDSYGERVDPRDFTAWRKDGSVFILTPHSNYSPQPVDVSASSDGRHTLFEFKDTPAILMRQGSKVMMLHLK